MRQSGILLHPTSLPGPEGIGTLGRDAHAFIDALARAGQRLWQLLPLGPTGLFNSPYMTSSALAGNPLLIDLIACVEAGWLDAAHLDAVKGADPGRVDFGALLGPKRAALDAVWEGFKAHADADARAAFERFKAAQADWLDPFATFALIADLHPDRSWTQWPTPLRDADADALASVRAEHADAFERVRFHQHLFAAQWDALKAHANAQGVKLVGDIPIFVAHHSADVWANRDLFWLDDSGAPTVVAGVPPDYFSATGQLWGNPLYRWDRMAEDGYGWWMRRFEACLAQVDLVRIDHFRGFEAYWEIPAGAPNAIGGTWVPGPGAAFFDALRDHLGDIPVIAEDLGIITPEVEALRDAFDLPGMKILHFAFGDDFDPDHAYLPHNYPARCVVYTGTHDNDTTVGWYAKLSERAAHWVRVYLSASGDDIAWTLTRAAWASPAETAIAPLQDLLSLGSEARMNTPGVADGNWAWRLQPGQLHDGHLDRLRLMTQLYGRATSKPS